MLYRIDHHGFQSRYYYCPCDPVNSISILPHHVCSLYGIKMTNILCGKRSIRATHSTIEYFDAVGPVKERMPQHTLQDLFWCTHVADDCNNDKGNGIPSI